jgi:Zn-dependent alcohol dehydrogenase
MTEGINPLDYDKPRSDVLIEESNGGLDYAFECVGTTQTINDKKMLICQEVLVHTRILLC